VGVIGTNIGGAMQFYFLTSPPVPAFPAVAP
jgi:hypothetical protein